MKITRVVVFLLVVALCLSGCSSTTPHDNQNSQKAEETSTFAESSEASSPEYTGKEITVEDIMCTDKQDTYMNYTMKIRNNTDVYIAHIRLNCQLLDSAGDAIYNFEWLFNELDPGQAVSAQEQINDLGSYKLADAVSIKVRSVEAYSKDGTLKKMFEFDYPEPIIITIKDIPMK